MGDWLGVALVLGVAFTIFILKFIFIRCYFNRSRRRTDLSWLDTDSRFPTTRDYFHGTQLYFYPDYPVPVSNFGSHVPPHCFNKGRQKPPPSFDKALKCSTPVKQVSLELIEEEEEPPPTYEDVCKKQNKPATPCCSSQLKCTVITTEV